MTRNDEIRRQISNLPTGQYRLSGQEFSVRRVEPKPTELPPIEWQGIVVCMPETEMGGDA